MSKNGPVRFPRCIQFGFRAFETYASDTAWLLHKGLEAAGFTLYGQGFGDNETDVQTVCEREKPDIVFLHSWDTWRPEAEGKRPTVELAGGDVGFSGYRWLGEQPGILRVTQYADPRPERSKEHREWQNDVFKPHVVLVRYDPANLRELNPWLRPDALLRIRHSLTAEYCPPVRPREGIALMSGCTSSAFYPLRGRLHTEAAAHPDLFALRPHHKWARGTGPDVPAYMAHLAEHRVAVVTASRWHWALKKHWEATAAGCICVTNLALEDPLPWIDENMVRIADDITIAELAALVHDLADGWDIERQRHFADLAVEHFDYRVEGCRIGAALRRRWRETIAEPPGLIVGDRLITDPAELAAMRAAIDAILQHKDPSPCAP